MTQVFWMLGEHGQALQVGERGLAIAEGLADVGIKSVATLGLGRVYHAVGDYRRASEWLSRCAAALEGNLRYEYFGSPILCSVISRTWLVWSLAELGEFSEGLKIAEEALQISEHIGHPLNLLSAHLGLGLLHLGKGELGAAIAALERSLGILEGWNISAWFHLTAPPLGAAYALAGRLDEALPLLEHAVQDAAERRRLGGYSFKLSRLCEGYRQAGRMDDAVRLSQLALDFSLKHQERGDQAGRSAFSGTSPRMVIRLA
jgi:tetratricopeptide (TPR) repeat protein